jgi:hypothetical protein
VSQLRKTTKKQNLLRSNPATPILLTLDTEEDEWEADDIIYVGYRRPELVKDNVIDDDLSEEIKWRLFLARQLALLKYKEKWA